MRARVLLCGFFVLACVASACAAYAALEMCGASTRGDSPPVAPGYVPWPR